jgi:hypothetical protein
MAGLVPAIHVLLRTRIKGVDARDKAGHDEFMYRGPIRRFQFDRQEFFSPLMTGPNRSQVSPLKRIICNCSSGAKSVGPVFILVPGR